MINGKRYSHLLNPKPDGQLEGPESVSVSTTKALIAGSPSSIALLKGETEGINFPKLRRTVLRYRSVRNSSWQFGKAGKGLNKRDKRYLPGPR